MNKIICKNYDEMSNIAADMVISQVRQKPDSVLGLATGSTPIGMYKKLIQMYKAGQADFSQVKTFNLDEYYKIDKDNPQSYNYYMHENFFKHVNINPQNIHIPNGSAENAKEECSNYDKMIEQSGGIDLQVLGIGVNGHIGFNEPATELNSKTHLTRLSIDTIRANARFFDSIDQVPTQAITVGMATILKAKKIILLISGKNKAEIMGKILNGKITTNIPASLLQLHPDTTIIVDEEAAYKLVS
ncbi:MAG: glucosamine-6-phosphate isomerase [Clostridia bacterium]|nr:glucosamine-6-phosphate isomerase [Clostridia bacterium]